MNFSDSNDNNNKYPAVDSSSFILFPKADVKAKENDLDLSDGQYDIQENISPYNSIKNKNDNAKKSITSAIIKHNEEGKIIEHYDSYNTVENMLRKDSFNDILITQNNVENIESDNDQVQVVSNVYEIETKINSIYANDSAKTFIQKINSFSSLPKEKTVSDEDFRLHEKDLQFVETDYGSETKKIEKGFNISTKSAANSTTESLESAKSIPSEDQLSNNNDVEKGCIGHISTPQKDELLFNNLGSRPGTDFHSAGCSGKKPKMQIEQPNGLETEKLREMELNNLVKETIKTRGKKTANKDEPANNIKSKEELRISGELSMNIKDQSSLESSDLSEMNRIFKGAESYDYQLNSVGDTERDILSDEVVLLSEMFPDIPLNHINFVLQDTHGDIETASEQLLNYDFIRGNMPLNEPKPDSKHINDRTEKDNLGRKEQNVGIEELIDILNKQDDILDMLELEDRHRDLVAWYLEQNNFNIPFTVYDILQNFSPSKPVEKQPRVDFLLASLNSVGSSSSSTSLTSSSVSSDISKQSLSQVLRYNASGKDCKQINDQHWLELMELVNSNEQLNFPRNFYVNALRWFANDVDKVLYVGTKLSMILNEKENKKISHKKGSKLDTRELLKEESRFRSRSSKKHYDDKIYNKSEKSEIHSAVTASAAPFRVSYDKLAKDVKNIRTDMASCRIKEANFFYQEKARIKNKQINELLESNTQKLIDLKLNEVAKTNCLDLHDLSVAAAKKCLEIALNHWWSDELYFRENNGDKLHLTKATHVGSLKVITGRGIHSAGGIPKVRNAVIRYLDTYKYVYNDNGSAFIVTGKKR